MTFDVYKQKRGTEWWLLDTVEALDAEDAILQAALKSRGARAGKYVAYGSMHDCGELEIKA